MDEDPLDTKEMQKKFQESTKDLNKSENTSTSSEKDFTKFKCVSEETGDESNSVYEEKK